jgi:hypothetical protein
MAHTQKVEHYAAMMVSIHRFNMKMSLTYVEKKDSRIVCIE